MTSRTKNLHDDLIVEKIEGVIGYLVFIAALMLAGNFFNIEEDLKELYFQIIRTLFIFTLFSLIYKLIEPIVLMTKDISIKLGKGLGEEISLFVIKAIKFLVVSIGFVAILQEWDYNISGFIASLGLVGMAFALAAKDTVSNLFGSLVLLVDKPFKVGDWIKTKDVEGTIEDIGIRSTKVRTFAKALVTVPNESLANSAILNWSEMNKRRIKMNVGLSYDSSSEQITKIVSDIKEMLKNHQDIHQETIHIYFSEMADSSLNIFCYYFTKTTKWDKFMKVREDTYLKILKIVEDNKAEIAFPTQKIYLNQ